jgi:hypothetical protein
MSKTKTSESNGRIIYEGVSLLDGAPIVVIAIGFDSGSSNRKTGDMIQTYIIRQDMAPITAAQTGKDFSICGDCIHRGSVAINSDGEPKNVGRTCYVNLGQGPTSVYNTYLRNGYPVWDDNAEPNLTKNRIVRLGTYGDPAAVPVEVWRSLLRGSSGHTGYTHQWRDPRVARLREYCMASADTVEESLAAQAKGWRTFRVGLPSHPFKQDNEALCPASAEAGRKLTCAQCRACDGTASSRRGSIYIPAHGGFAVMANIKKRDDLQVCKAEEV